jgi:hypothetical protein
MRRVTTKPAFSKRVKTLYSRIPLCQPRPLMRANSSYHGTWTVQRNAHLNHPRRRDPFGTQPARQPSAPCLQIPRKLARMNRTAVRPFPDGMTKASNGSESCHLIISSDHIVHLVRGRISDRRSIASFFWRKFIPPPPNRLLSRIASAPCKHVINRAHVSAALDTPHGAAVPERERVCGGRSRPDTAETARETTAIPTSRNRILKP